MTDQTTINKIIKQIEEDPNREEAKHVSRLIATRALNYFANNSDIDISLYFPSGVDGKFWNPFTQKRALNTLLQRVETYYEGATLRVPFFTGGISVFPETDVLNSSFAVLMSLWSKGVITDEDLQIGHDNG